MCSICCMTTLCLNNRVATPLHAADNPPKEDLLQLGKLKRTVAAHFNVAVELQPYGSKNLDGYRRAVVRPMDKT